MAGIPVTSVERTSIDIAGRLDDRQLEHALVEVERSGRLRWLELERVIEQSKGRKGLRRLRRVAARVDPRSADTVSPTEVDFVVLCREANLPPPQVNVLVEGHIVDFYWPKSRLVVETDGYAFHKDRPAFERDRETTAALMSSGYKVLRATDQMLKVHPGRFLGLVQDSLGL
jgi:very-short-patch-repair endonuclease